MYTRDNHTLTLGSGNHGTGSVKEISERVLRCPIISYYMALTSSVSLDTLNMVIRIEAIELNCLLHSNLREAPYSRLDDSRKDWLQHMSACYLKVCIDLPQSAPLWTDGSSLN